MVGQQKIPITVLVQTKDEEAGIRACLTALADFDEVIVVDSNSRDKTAKIALLAGAKVVNFTWDRAYPKKKQWQIDNVETRNSWLLFMDADETPSAALIDELRLAEHKLQSMEFVAADISLEYVFAGKALRYGHTVVKRALVHRESVEFPVIDDLEAPGMGELEGHYQPVANGKVAKFKGRIIHNDLDPVRTWFDRHNRYSDWEAYLRENPNIQKEAAKRRSKQGRLFDRIPMKSLVFFVYSYIIKLGFLDHRAGLDYSIALSLYYWQIGLKTREIRRSVKTNPSL